VTARAGSIQNKTDTIRIARAGSIQNKTDMIRIARAGSIQNKTDMIRIAIRTKQYAIRIDDTIQR